MMWNKYFSNEKELINALAQIDVHKFNEFCNGCGSCRYITGMIRALHTGRDLSPAQLRMAKNHADKIKAYYKAI